MATTYQRTHRPTARIENRCPNEDIPADGICPTCNRQPLVPGRRSHKPNTHGAYGWTLYYGDGSVVIEEATC